MATYAHKNLKVTWGGTMYSRKEIWSNGVHFGFENADFEFDSVDTASSIQPQMITAIQTWFKSNAAGISRAVSLEWVKFAIIGEDGKYALLADGSYEHYETFDFTPILGATETNITAQYVAPQLSVAITLETAVRRGRARFGRVYPPCTGVPTTTGYDSDPAGKALAFMNLINAMNDTTNGFFPEADPKVIVASGIAPGKNAHVRTVKVGNVIDTQRRRRNQLVETYVTRDVAGFQVG